MKNRVLFACFTVLGLGSGVGYASLTDQPAHIPPPPAELHQGRNAPDCLDELQTVAQDTGSQVRGDTGWTLPKMFLPVTDEIFIPLGPTHPIIRHAVRTSDGSAFYCDSDAPGAMFWDTGDGMTYRRDLLRDAQHGTRLWQRQDDAAHDS